MQILTVGQTFSELKQSLSEYIQAAYHISNPKLIQQRIDLLNAAGVISQIPFLESTPRYCTGNPFNELAGLNPAAVTIFKTKSSLTNRPLIFDPPYEHQEEAIRQTLVLNKSIIVTTGTGSGKTECFLLPILGKLAIEAHDNSDSFKNYPAVRALILYPMNALVNDQLSRLRLCLGDKNIIEKFKEWTGRPARFARYTGRTLYAGVRSSDKDSDRLKSLRDFYVEVEITAQTGEPQQKERAKKLITELKSRGKWPSKPSVAEWFGKDRQRWQDKNGNFVRCITGPLDAELFTRHEVQACPPDVLITNYSMLEYMLLRPIEKPIFEKTKEWLACNPDEKFMLIIDEAHLYRGAAGTEVALLIRRLRMRLGIPLHRLQVICTSASFNDREHAVKFAAELTGKSIDDFSKAISGKLKIREPALQGSFDDAEHLSRVDLGNLYSSDPDTRKQAIVPLLSYLNTPFEESVERTLWIALKDFGPLNLLINASMKEALPIDELGTMLFEKCDSEVSGKAVSVLISLASVAREKSEGPNLLPCRVHAFFRGLPGVWACCDPDCSQLDTNQKSGIVGKMYHQPRQICDCGARVFELYTCRNCGTAYLRAYTDNIQEPTFLWPEQGKSVSTQLGISSPILSLDILVENPTDSADIEPIVLDIVTGRVNPENLGSRYRTAYITKNRLPKHPNDTQMGEFKPCGVCDKTAGEKSYVQDLQTKGDQPFEALITKQLQVQPPSSSYSEFAPLRGRKVLIFSDSRQGAAKLAPRLQEYSMQDALRPLLIYGYNYLSSIPEIKARLNLEDIYFATLLSANILETRLRPSLKTTESMQAFFKIKKAISSGVLQNPSKLFDLMLDIRSFRSPESLLRLLYKCICDSFYGLEALAIASLSERDSHNQYIINLPHLPAVANTPEQKMSLARLWLTEWCQYGFQLSSTPEGWRNREVKMHTGRFRKLNRILGTEQSRFNETWLPVLLELFTIPCGEKHILKGTEVTLALGGTWASCQRCRTTQRPYPEKNICKNCGTGKVITIDPDTNSVFKARKGYYRNATIEALRIPATKPMAFVADEHTAQLNTANFDEIFSDAEENELLFQDVDLGQKTENIVNTAIDVLSCTTTMEVGIDIGKLSGVALRNMPPARANYQQRAGRAGRRGNAVATVIAFGSSDTHDEQYFTNPEQMIKGAVVDPTLTLNNRDITVRHVLAYLLQRYHSATLTNIEMYQLPQLFEVLGTDQEFLNPSSKLNILDFEAFLSSNRAILRNELDQWLPTQLNNEERNSILANFPEQIIATLKSCFEVRT